MSSTPLTQGPPRNHDVRPRPRPLTATVQWNASVAGNCEAIGKDRPHLSGLLSTYEQSLSTAAMLAGHFLSEDPAHWTGRHPLPWREPLAVVGNRANEPFVVGNQEHKSLFVSCALGLTTLFRASLRVRFA